MMTYTGDTNTKRDTDREELTKMNIYGKRHIQRKTQSERDIHKEKHTQKVLHMKKDT